MLRTNGDRFQTTSAWASPGSPLDAPVPERPRGVPTVAIQLLDDLQQLQPLALADPLDALTLGFGERKE
jgi:hypothetical protein